MLHTVCDDVRATPDGHGVGSRRTGVCWSVTVGGPLILWIWDLAAGTIYIYRIVYIHIYIQALLCVCLSPNSRHLHLFLAFSGIISIIDSWYDTLCWPPIRLVVQDTRFSPWRHGFEPRMGEQAHNFCSSTLKQLFFLCCLPPTLLPTAPTPPKPHTHAHAHAEPHHVVCAVCLRMQPCDTNPVSSGMNCVSVPGRSPSPWRGPSGPWPRQKCSRWMGDGGGGRGLRQGGVRVLRQLAGGGHVPRAALGTRCLDRVA